MRRLIELKRYGFTFNELLIEILGSKHLLGEVGLYNILMGLELPVFDSEYVRLDMCSEQWLQLPVEKQIDYASDYQRWYAVMLGQPIEQDFKTSEKSGTRMVFIPPGSCWIGSPPSEVGRHIGELRERIHIREPFWMGKYPITQYDYLMFSDNRGPGSQDAYAVTGLAFRDCLEFCKSLNFMLPDSMLWEYACRAGTTTAYSFGDSAEKLKDYAWYKRNSAGRDHKVGLKKPNAWGLHDMHGNVWEWCLETPSEYPYMRLAKGGSRSDVAEVCRSANFIRQYANLGVPGTGFRVMRYLAGNRPGLDIFRRD